MEQTEPHLMLTHLLPFSLAWRKDKIRFFPPSGKDKAAAPHPAHLQVRGERGYLRGDEPGAGEDGTGGMEERKEKRREGEQGRSWSCVAWRLQTLPGVLRGGTVPVLLLSYPEGPGGMLRA